MKNKRITVLAGVFLSAALSLFGATEDSRRREFLQGPTSYLLTKAERSQFEALRTPAEHESFIERFWEARNPNPGTGSNEFKDEFYRRLAYVNTFYGADAGSDGWRTDRGRTYLLFGKPQNVSTFHGNQELVPTELWFYSNPGLRELPPFFYVMFFDRSGSGEYRFYHPYVHGPDKLVRSEPEKAQAYRYLRSINLELATASLTLIPGEPVDTETFAGSMSSAAVMNAINGFNEMKSYTTLISARWARLERVQSKIDYEVSRSGLMALVAYENGEPWLHWHFELQDRTAKAPSGRMSYEVSSKLYANEQLVYERSDAPSFDLPEAAKSRPFVYEDRMPVAPGKYRLEVVIKDNFGRSFDGVRQVVVPTAAELGISEVIAVGKREPEQRKRPFQFGAVRFQPMSEPVTLASRGLNVLYQVRLPSERPQELSVEYVIADSFFKAKKTTVEKIDAARADANGTLFVARTLDLAEFGPGAYQLAVRFKDPVTGKIAASQCRFAVAAEDAALAPIVVSPAPSEAPERQAAQHYERALAWLAQGDRTQAIACLQASWQLSKNQAVEGLLSQLNVRANGPGVQKTQ
jgi:GWxTD domain-containing protein